jgi:hypothetical protein
MILPAIQWFVLECRISNLLHRQKSLIGMDIGKVFETVNVFEVVDTPLLFLCWQQGRWKLFLSMARVENIPDSLSATRWT